MRFLYVCFLFLAYCASAHAQCVDYPVAGRGSMYIGPCAGFVQGTKPPPLSLPAFKAGNYGATPAAVMAAMPAFLLEYFETNPNLDAVITRAGPITIARMSTELAALDTTAAEYTHWILAYAIVRGVSVANLKMLHAAFGDVAMSSVLHYMSAATLAAYNTLPPGQTGVIPLPYSQMSVNCGGKLPPYDLTQRYLYDLYLEHVFAGNDTLNVAVHKTMLYAQVRIHNVVVTTIEVVAAVWVATLATIDFVNGPNYTKIADWWYFMSLDPAWDSGKIVTIPDMTISIPDLPPLPDPVFTDFPPISGIDDPYAFDFEY